VKRDSFRLGEYGPAEPAALRGRFLRAVFEVAPESFSSLVALLPRCSKRKLAEWAKRWHVTDLWCIEGVTALLCVVGHYSMSASRIMREGSDHDPKGRPLTVNDFQPLDYLFAQFAAAGDLPPFLAALPLPPAPRPFRFEHPAWDATLSTRTEFEAAIRSAFDKALHQYWKRIETAACAQGFRRTRDKRNPEHLYWLARYQVRHESPAAIWRSLPARDNRTRRAVEKAIGDAARAIGLTRR
jgi:hypothetical protein